VDLAGIAWVFALPEGFAIRSGNFVAGVFDVGLFDEEVGSVACLLRLRVVLVVEGVGFSEDMLRNVGWWSG
jgi:hypothetical protein